MSGVDLAQWLGAQLDADERIARAACDGGDGWTADEQASCECCTNVRTATGALVCTPDDRDAPHIAEWSPARVLREIEAKRELLAEYERLLRAHAAHRKEAARMATEGDDDPTRIAALRREADYLPAMLHVMERWAKQKAGVYEARPGYAEAIASL